MKKKPHPDRTAEAASVREELYDQPDALRSLDALSRENEPDVEIPPVPEDLREQWKDRYGAARQAVAEEKTSWFSRVRHFWLLTGTAAVAAVAVMISLKEDPPSPVPSASGGSVILRGADAFTSSKDTIAILIPSEEISFPAFAATRQEGFAREAADLESAVDMLKAEQIMSAVIVDVNTGRFHPWSGALHEATPFITISPETDEYDLSEALDNFLQE